MHDVIERTAMKALRTTLVILCIATLGVRVFDATRAAAAGARLLIEPDPAYPGGMVAAIGNDLCAPPCGAVTLRVGDEVVAQNVRVDARGRFSATFRAPFASGSYTVRAMQMRGSETLEVDVDLTVATTDVNLSDPGPTVASLAANSSPRTTTPPPTSPPAPTGTTVAPVPATRPPATTRSATSTTRLPTSTTTLQSEPTVPAAESSSTNPWPWVLLGLAILAAVAIAAALWYRARGRRAG
jgi:hypothetical protein